MNNYGELVKEELSKENSFEGYLSERILSSPKRISREEFSSKKNEHRVITAFFSTAMNVYRNVILSNKTSLLKKYLLNDSVGQDAHKILSGLPESTWHIPHFFRTDASRNNGIYEIQCPGSGWGDNILLENIYLRKKLISEDECYNVDKSFYSELQRITGEDNPTVLHLLDNSSSPSLMRYFLYKTSLLGIKYFGYSKDAISKDINFVRSHSVQGLVSENLFKIRLEKVNTGRLKFDVPPLLIFDQKMILTLPFLEETKKLFSDDIRNALVYTTVLTDEGFVDEKGRWVKISDFIKRSPSQRKYYLKYGGCDTSINWGSRAVYRLDSNSVREIIKKGVVDYKLGRPWVIQPDVSDKETVSFFDLKTQEIQTQKMTSKYSVFYGPSGLMSVRCHHRGHNKVHGQEDSVVGMVYQDYGSKVR